MGRADGGGGSERGAVRGWCGRCGAHADVVWVEDSYQDCGRVVVWFRWCWGSVWSGGSAAEWWCSVRAVGFVVWYWWGLWTVFIDYVIHVCACVSDAICRVVCVCCAVHADAYSDADSEREWFAWVLPVYRGILLHRSVSDGHGDCDVNPNCVEWWRWRIRAIWLRCHGYGHGYANCDSSSDVRAVAAACGVRAEAGECDGECVCGSADVSEWSSGGGASLGLLVGARLRGIARDARHAARYGRTELECGHCDDELGRSDSGLDAEAGEYASFG